MSTRVRVRGLPPLVDSRSRVLILGSLPGKRSLSLRQYYAGLSNDFWKIMRDLFGLGPSADYCVRESILLEKGIALWDVLEEASREGSLDSSIRDEKPNRLSSFLQDHCSIERVYLNGEKASQLCRKYNRDLVEETRYGFVILPSSSSQNRRHYSSNEKIARWRVIQADLQKLTASNAKVSS